MNEQIIVSGDEASLSLGTLLENMGGGGSFNGTLSERWRRKLWSRVSISVGARWGSWGVR